MKNLLRILAVISFVIILPVSVFAEVNNPVIICDPGFYDNGVGCVPDNTPIGSCPSDTYDDGVNCVPINVSAPGPGATSSIPCPAGTGKICDPLGERFGTVPELIKTILEGAIRIGLPVIALAIVFSGFLFVFARGNPEKLTKAKDALLYTLIGAAILLGSWAIAKMIQTTVFSLS